MKETLPVIYQDLQLIAVHKPSGLLVHRTAIDRHETRFAVQIVRNQTGRHVFPVHRLDRGTSGILLFALDRESARQMAERLQMQRVEKTYLAIVRGHPEEKGRILHPLTREFDDYEFRPAGTISPTQAACTDYRRLATTELPYRVDRYPKSRYALIELMPHTGRKHQLRRHMKHIAHPIIGDATYGKGRHNRLFQTLFGTQRLLLACTGMRFTHPQSGEPLNITAPPADDFAQVCKALGWTRHIQMP